MRQRRSQMMGGCWVYSPMEKANRIASLLEQEGTAEMPLILKPQLSIECQCQREKRNTRRMTGQ
jgi:hypothetical protein